MTILKRLAELLTPGLSRHARGQITTELQITTGAEGFLSIPIPSPSNEDKLRDCWQRKGQRLARQEDWGVLTDLIRQADQDRALTPGGMSVAELLAYGARSDVVGAIEHAFMHGHPDPDAPILAGIEALEGVLNDHPDNEVIAVIVAQTHIDMAWTWQGHSETDATRSLGKEGFDAHMDRARDVLSPFRDLAAQRPSLLAAWCGLRGNTNHSAQELSQNYARLIDLNPLDFRHMRALGRRVVENQGTQFARITLEARNVAARHHDLWGAGGYTWVALDAISSDMRAMAEIDAKHFVQGLRDILALQPDQFTVNLLAAYCAVTMKEPFDDKDADANRAHIHACHDWIICDYLTELHPLLWAHAAHKFDNNLRVYSLDRFAENGQKAAKRILNRLFLPELARGQNVIFTENGPVAQMS